jgi:hypothetical protein
MTRVEWNSLRVGDVVHVHHPVTGRRPARRGVITAVTQRTHRTNEIGVRLDDDTQSIVWPSSVTVHPEATSPTGSCWRCDELPAVGVPGRQP